jgi:hypothetical protein
MAATKGNAKLLASFPYVIEECYYTTLDPGAGVTHTLRNQINVAPFHIACVVTHPATSGDPIFFVFDESETSLTAGANTVKLIFDTVAGGDLTGAQVKVLIYHLSQAAGGISA